MKDDAKEKVLFRIEPGSLGFESLGEMFTRESLQSIYVAAGVGKIVAAMKAASCPSLIDQRAAAFAAMTSFGSLTESINEMLAGIRTLATDLTFITPAMAAEVMRCASSVPQTRHSLLSRLMR